MFDSRNQVQAENVPFGFRSFWFCSRFNEQRSRALYFDGHFQVMDDSISRDKLVKGFKALYDDSDIESEQLEELFEDYAEKIENESGEFFQQLLVVSLGVLPTTAAFSFGKK